MYLTIYVFNGEVLNNLSSWYSIITDNSGLEINYYYITAACNLLVSVTISLSKTSGSVPKQSQPKGPYIFDMSMTRSKLVDRHLGENVY